MTDEPSGNETPEKTVIDISVERMRQEHEALKAQHQVVVDQLSAVIKERDAATSFLEKNERGIAVDDLKKMGCTYSVEEFDKMSLGDLDKLKENYRYFKPPATFKSGADVSGKVESTTGSLDSIYIPLEERRKNM